MIYHLSQYKSGKYEPLLCSMFPSVHVHACPCLCIHLHVNMPHSCIQWRALAKWASSSSQEGAFQRKSMARSSWRGWPAGKVMGGVKKNQRFTSIWVSMCFTYRSAVTLLMLMLIVYGKDAGGNKSRLCLSAEGWSNSVQQPCSFRSHSKTSGTYCSVRTHNDPVIPRI